MQLKDKKDLMVIYRRTLLPALYELEGDRRKARSKIISVWVFILIVSLACFANFRSDPKLTQFLIMIIVGLSTLGLILGRQLTKGFRHHYKQQVVKKVFEALVGEVEFNPESSIREELIKSTGLFGVFNRHHGEDYVSGRFREKKFEMSEHLLEHVTRSGKNTKRRTVFEGLCFRLSLDRSFQCDIRIVPDSAESLFGQTMGRFFQKGSEVLSGFELVELESLEFEKYYKVTSNSQFGARKLLNPAVLNRMVHFREKHRDDKIYLAVMGAQIFVFLNSRSDFFEPSLWGEWYSFQSFEEIFEIFELFDSLLSSLKVVEEKIN